MKNSKITASEIRFVAWLITKPINNILTQKIGACNIDLWCSFSFFDHNTSMSGKFAKIIESIIMGKVIKKISGNITESNFNTKIPANVCDIVFITPTSENSFLNFTVISGF